MVTTQIIQEEKILYQMEDWFSCQKDRRHLYVYEDDTRRVRNVSSIELNKLLCLKSSNTSSKLCSYEDCGDFLQPCKHVLNCKKIIVQRCQNKGCMCKPLIDGKPKCQLVDDVVQTSFGSEVKHTIITKSAENQTTETLESTKAPTNQDQKPDPNQAVVSDTELGDTGTKQTETKPSETDDSKSEFSEPSKSDFSRKSSVNQSEVSSERRKSEIGTSENEPSKLSIEPSRSSIEPTQANAEPSKLSVAPAKLNGEPSTLNGEQSKLNGESSKPNGESSKPNGESSKANGESSKPNGESSKPNGESSKPNGESSKPNGESSKSNGEPPKSNGEPTKSDTGKEENNPRKSSKAESKSDKKGKKKDETKSAQTKSAAKAKPIKYTKMCPENPCKPCPSQMRFCVPSNFEQLITESGDDEIEFIHCKNRDLCTCEPYNVEDGLKRGIKLPGNNICIQSTPAEKIEPKKPVEKVKPEKVKKPPKEKPIKPAKTSSSETCCFCFTKKKKTTKKDSEKSIQTLKQCCVNKICQKGTSTENCCCDPKGSGGDNIDEPSATVDKIRSIWICSRCGKIYNNTCKKCKEIPCSRNALLLPPSPGSNLTNDQTETLRTLIKLEAKQNYRQIDNILQELTDQRNEIKKLNEMYQAIGGVAKRRNSVKIQEVDNIGLENTPNVYICEGCDVDINRNVLRALRTRAERRLNIDNEDDLIDNDTDFYQPLDNKHLKNVINGKKRSTKPEKEIQTLNLSDKVIQTKNIEPPNQKNTKQEIRDHLLKDKLEKEKPYVDYDKIDEGTQSIEWSFLNWCKRSLTSIKEIRSRDFLRRKCHTLQNKYKECKKSLTHLKEQNSIEELRCNYQSLKDKVNECKKMYDMKLAVNKNKQKYGGLFLHNKIIQCKEVNEAKMKKTIVASWVNYCK